MKNTWLVTGGCRSGKSRYALELAKHAEKPFYIATGWAGDAEMADRIKKHQLERGPSWKTIETKTEILFAIQDAIEQGADFIIIDCVTFWVTNLMCEEKNIQDYVSDLTGSLPDSPYIVFVTNEVGYGIVPDNKMAREFRDLAGWTNQQLAAAVGNVVLCVCGIPMKVK